MPMSKGLGELVVKDCKPEEFEECDMVFSGLDSDVAQDTGEYKGPPKLPPLKRRSAKQRTPQKWPS